MIRGTRSSFDWHVILVYMAPAIVAAMCAWIVGDIVQHGIGKLSWSFLVDPPLRSGRQGGIGPILLSTLLIVSICLAVALPVAVGAALLLSEFIPRRSRAARAVRLSLDVLAGMPSVVFGLFGSAFFCGFLGFGFSILAGGLTLACMVLPVMIRTAEEALRCVPNAYRLGASALGMTRTRAILTILLPMARPGIIVGILLSVGRAMAETAALVFTSGYVDRTPSSVLDSGRALSVHIFDLALNVPGGDAPAYRASVVLLGLLLLINGVMLCMSILLKRLTGVSAST
ncbi:MAG: phosphate ABC transporter permease PstA [Rhodospirillaceae bacterium]|nr:phosphate ABC transporter permease PstA [Rhodospirillales bacterium]